MAPKKKRRRKSVKGSDVGISLQEKDAALTQRETFVPDGNREENKRGGYDEQLSQTGNSYLTEEEDFVEHGQVSLEENRCTGIRDDSPEKTAESQTEATVSSKEIVCPQSITMQLLEIDFSEKLDKSTREENVSSQETVCPPKKRMQVLEAEASGAPVNDSGSDNSIRKLLQIVDVRSEVPDKENELELELPICTVRAEGSGKSDTDSSETKIFDGTPKKPRNSVPPQEPTNNENLSLSKICASQKTGQSGAEDGNADEVIVPRSCDVFAVGRDVTVVSHSCPEDIGVLVSDRQRFQTPALYAVGKKLPVRGKFGLQLHHTNFTGFHFSHGGSVIRESLEPVEQQNRGGENERHDISSQGLSAWSAQSEYFPRGKPSDLGELLEVATCYVVKAWLKGMHPPISGPPTNLAIKFCVDCHKKYCYDENEPNHLCSKRVGGSQKALKLMFYAELELCDETQEMLKVALTGDQAAKLFGCKPQEFVRNEEFQKRVWNSFKHLIKGGNAQNLRLEDAAKFSLEPHLNFKEKKMNYRVVDIRPFSSRWR